MTIDNDKKFSKLMADWGYAPSGNGAAKIYDEIVAYIDAQMERDRKDAERFRWLRDRMALEHMPPEHPAWSKPSEDESVKVDAAIDAELAKNKKEIDAG